MVIITVVMVLIIIFSLPLKSRLAFPPQKDGTFFVPIVIEHEL